MAKSIKKTLKYLIIAAGILIILPTLLFSGLRIPQVQTFLLRRVTDHLSEKIKSTITFSGIEYIFFNRVNVSDLLIRDQNNDTLIYSQSASAGINKINLRKRTYTLGRVELINPVVSFITDSSGIMNLTWYIDMLKEMKDTAKNRDMQFRINQVDINNARFSIISRLGKGIEKEGIDFKNLNLSGINGIIEDIKVADDTTSFSIYNLSFLESSGFMVNRIVSEVKLSKNNIGLLSGRINCDSSIINFPHLFLRTDSTGDFKDFINDVKLDILLEKSLISSMDLNYFIPKLKGINESLWCSGRITGTVSEMRGRKIQIEYGENTKLDCDFDISGLPEIENSFIYLGVNNLTVNTNDIENINLPGKGTIILPDIISDLGKFSFDGSFTGFTTDFVTYGNIRTDKGTIKTDISLRPGNQNTFHIRGLINGNSLALGKLTGNPMLGNLSFKTDVDGYAYSLNRFSGDLTGMIDSVEINGYKYHDISLEGIFSEKTWDGSVKIAEENIKFDLLGMFNFSQERSEFDFTLNLTRADLYRLNFDKTDTTSSISLLMTANFKGNNIDNMEGEIKLLNSNLVKYGSPLELYDFSINTFTENTKPAINLRTDYADADLRGDYSFSGLGTLFRSALSSMFPSKFNFPQDKQALANNRFAFNISLKNTDRLNTFFRTGIFVSDKSSIKGEIFADSLMRLSGKAGSMNIKNNIFNDLALEAEYKKPNLNVAIRSSSLSILAQPGLKDFTVNIFTRPDNFAVAFNWDDHQSVLNKGNFLLTGFYALKEGDASEPLLIIKIDSSDIFVRNNLWKVHAAEMIIDTSSYDIRKVYISSQYRYYMVNGKVSSNQNDTLSLRFNGIDISPLNALVSRKDEANSIPLSINGRLNGQLQLTGIYENPLLESNLLLRDFSMLNNEYGDISITSKWNNDKKVADISATNNLNGTKMLDIGGAYDPGTKEIDLTFIADKLPVDALNPLLKVFASGISGTASGKVRLSGDIKKLVLNGSVMAENSSMKIDYLQTRFRFNDSIRFDASGILFRNLRLADERGNTATLNGSVNHKYFREYSPDLTISFNDCMVLNTRPKDNELFYGTAFATGITTIKSNQSTLSFDISARTEKNTKFFIPLNSSATVSDYSFVTFISQDTVPGEIMDAQKSIPEQQTGMDLNFDLEVTPDAEVQLIFDPVMGDAMKAHGSGNLNIRLDTKGNFRISGDYIIDDGDYLFTLGNLFNKPFSVENGGRLTFNGDIDNAEIELKAIYNLKASLFELFQEERFRERIPVECQINLSGRLFNPIVSFNIYLPMADDATRSLVRNVITTEEELSRQFLYLLVMNSFYADPAMGSGMTTTSTGTSAMAVTTTEMFSNQVSNWLSQLSNDFDLGFVYRPGRDINPQEVELALSTQLLNDRVRINGNFDYRGTDKTSDNTDQLTGDFDIETTITEKIKFKVFNRFNNPYTGKGVPYTQGFGLFFRQEFDKFSDLFKKRDKSEMKKEDEPVISDNL